jgi:hypothetical protein
MASASMEQDAPAAAAGQSAPVSDLAEIRLATPPTTLRCLHPVPDGRKLDYGRTASGNAG